MAKYKGVVVNMCCGAYTLKTCGCCGNINYKLGGDRIYDCSKCNLSIDRDYNGPRNIYLRNIQ